MIGLLAYGSLMHPDELVEYRAHDSPLVPVRVRGFRRSFCQEPSWRTRDVNERAVLTLRSSTSHWCNAIVVCGLKAEALALLDHRERGYLRQTLPASFLEPYAGKEGLKTIEEVHVYTGWGPGSVLIDDFMPSWNVRSHHQITVNASREDTFAAVRTADLGAHPAVRAMLGLRALPSALVSDRFHELRERASRSITLAEFEGQGFRILAETAPSDLLIGLEGAFWKPGGALRPVSPATFKDPVPTGIARAAWSFTVESVSATQSVLATETRVLTGGDSARRRFRFYWVFVGWGSGLIRRLMLRSIKAEAERGGSGSAQRRRV